MQLICPSCHHVFDSSITYIKTTEDLWKTTCPKCQNTYTIYNDMTKANVVMAFVNDKDEDGNEKPIDNYSTTWDAKDIYAIYAFNTIDEFWSKWCEIVETPDTPWYHVLYKGAHIYSGICDWDDQDIFENAFREDNENNKTNDTPWDDLSQYKRIHRFWQFISDHIDKIYCLNIETDTDFIKIKIDPEAIPDFYKMCMPKEPFAQINLEKFNATVSPSNIVIEDLINLFNIEIQCGIVLEHDYHVITAPDILGLMPKHLADEVVINIR